MTKPASALIHLLNLCALVATFALLGLAPCQSLAEPTPQSPFPSLYAKADIFKSSIEAAQRLQIRGRRISGLTVPHHLIAADLMARAFRVAEGNHYDKIVILFPDHFKKTTRPFATTRRSFETVFGTLTTSEEDVSRLLSDARIVEESELFAKDHGIGALLPYVKHFFPDTPIVPIAVSIGSVREDWERLIADLAPVITAKTLILQSTDFSHYLPHHEAIQRDQEVLNILAANDFDAVAKLRQPAHLDSRGSQYLQMRLQTKHFRTRPLVILNANSQIYSDHAESETTSYIVQIYPAAEDAGLIDPPDPSAAQTYCFAGDTFFGRFMQKLLANQGIAGRLRKEVQSRLAGCPLIVNFEGVTVAKVPRKLWPLTLAMPEDLALDWLKALNVVAVSLANNHAKDLGDKALDAMVTMLKSSGLKVLRHGEIEDFGPFRLVGLTDIDNSTKPYVERINDADLAAVGRSDASPPLVAFLHWGEEFQTSPNHRQKAVADDLRRCGVSLIVGTHPHRALPHIDALAGGETAVAYSLGNFLFDQFDKRSSGAVLEVRFFPQGTFFARLVPMPNFFHMARYRNWPRQNASQ